MVEAIRPEVRLAITDVLHRFYWLVDHGRADEGAGLFVPDARIFFGPGSPKPGAIEGIAIQETFIARAAMKHVTTRHALSNVVVTPNEDGSASAYSLLTLYRSDTEHRPSIPAIIADVQETLVLTPVGWRIRERTIMPIFHRD